ncbi:MAG: hypothetical protein CM15mP51_14390 [Porticoccaceae bacterium]|nr:MAG: hypothetical protein CM15mP51_14390 [Porticoccaceae bacterium]
MNKSRCAHHPQKYFFLEVMGRHAGWIAASGGLAASKKVKHSHHSVSRNTFYREAFIERIETTVRQKGYCVIVASEGIRYSDGAHIFGDQCSEMHLVISNGWGCPNISKHD